MSEKGKDFEVYKHGEYECWRTPLDTSECWMGILCRYFLRKEGKNPLIIIGRNSNTAREGRPDTTMEIADRFCQKKGYDGYIMLNLYPQMISDVEALSAYITDHIHAVNMNVIEESIRKNKTSDILFILDSIDKEKISSIFIKTYDDIKNLLIGLIGNGIISKNKIFKLAKINIETNEIETFAYPPHFSNQAFKDKKVKRIIDPDPFDFEAYHI